MESGFGLSFINQLGTGVLLGACLCCRWVVGRAWTVAGDLDRGRFRPRLGGGKRGVRMRVFSMGCESWGV